MKAITKIVLVQSKNQCLTWQQLFGKELANVSPRVSKMSQNVLKVSVRVVDVCTQSYHLGFGHDH